MSHESRLDEMLAELVDVGREEDYHRMRADLYAAVLLAVNNDHAIMTKQKMRELAREALVAEEYNPKFRDRTVL